MNQNKQASIIAPNSSLLETFAASGALGAGGFATLRLLQDIMSAAQRKHGPGEDENTLTVDLPRNMMPPYMAQMQQQQAPAMTPPPAPLNKQAGDNLNKIMAILGGAPLGFMGAKTVYDKFKQYQLQQELDLANQRYMQTMESFRPPLEEDQNQMSAPKYASEETPTVDAFCEKLAEELNKESGIWEGLKNAVPASLGMDTTPKHQALMDVGGQIAKDQAVRNVPKVLFPFGMDKVVRDGLLIAMLGTGAAAFGGMAYANKNREEAEKKRHFPSAVEINYAQ